MYIKIETLRLDFHRIKQSKIQSELYQKMVNSVIVEEARGSQVGKMIVLPQLSLVVLETYIVDTMTL